MRDVPIHPAITTAFTELFRLALVSSPQELAEAQRLRYDVYCTELQFDPPENYPDQRETDEFEEQSWHCVLRYEPRDRPALHRLAGHVRIVHANATPLRLPMVQNCGESLDPEDPDHPATHDPALICEISRLAVHSDFRRRRGEGKSAYGEVDSLAAVENHPRTFPLAAVSLFMASARIVQLAGKEHAYAMMEPQLARHCVRQGLHFRQIGKTVYYHERKRAPFHIRFSEALENIQQSEQLLSPLFRMATSQIQTLRSFKQASAPEPKQ
ncbi:MULTISPECIES: PEP-CTERM/exosortase system-associated acyltransferase [Halorhodospira]|uniref:PEP-CTERM/exosortase system-associated acyltransferase n=1 Tax=Halorhodospira TaxID=85108 RepID=UPI001EE88D5A|nr:MULTISPECIES: PEP-CTERM/exosortase system-associated acyltransferase [Halorhodospira]MCG5528042.1 PEP-CTERM/exosortase system-associated acyltransferase [Halorhodospira halophila]MCG5542088.1 PEP-CTERM/exosortase system-associated acyltransferase [Halorhodospira sp. 9628]